MSTSLPPKKNGDIFDCFQESELCPEIKVGEKNNLLTSLDLVKQYMFFAPT